MNGLIICIRRIKLNILIDFRKSHSTNLLSISHCRNRRTRFIRCISIKITNTRRYRSWIGRISRSTTYITISYTTVLTPSLCISPLIDLKGCILCINTTKSVVTNISQSRGKHKVRRNTVERKISNILKTLVQSNVIQTRTLLKNIILNYLQSRRSHKCRQTLTPTKRTSANADDLCFGKVNFLHSTITHSKVINQLQISKVIPVYSRNLTLIIQTTKTNNLCTLRKGQSGGIFISILVIIQSSIRTNFTICNHKSTFNPSCTL